MRISVLQDGTERLIDSLSLIDAVMPDVVASRQQQNQQPKAVVKTEIPSTNGDEGGHLCSLLWLSLLSGRSHHTIARLLLLLLFLLLFLMQERKLVKG
ncbi:hypothetical protein E2C01_087639 [Portunus trituberculatus]|uniref:Uncharacterized protein n=1 Tax=Portunus trituberculatus TaxID=210409 RepID=A0A5B7JD11_PORTR|nr:hypothetical protein [Portunus trituberculatus]